MLYDHEPNPYVEHLRAEHRRLHAMLRQTRSIFLQSSSPDCDATTDDVVRVLLQVRSEMTHHFDDEEAGGCLEEAVSRCPHLSGEVTRVQAEHPELLRQIDRLLAQAKDSCNTLVGRLAFARDFDELCLLLHAHEAAENDILRQGFGRLVNGDSESHTLPLDV
jgi:hypothetical protein